jgi:hypothetical protein
MAVRHLSYLDLTPDQRYASAGLAREKLRGLLANPFLTREQLTSINDQIHRIDLWEKGELQINSLGEKPSLPPAPEVKALPAAASSEKEVSEGTAHSIDLAEDISVDEDI